MLGTIVKDIDPLLIPHVEEQQTRDQEQRHEPERNVDDDEPDTTRHNEDEDGRAEWQWCQDPNGCIDINTDTGNKVSSHLPTVPLGRLLHHLRGNRLGDFGRNIPLRHACKRATNDHTNGTRQTDPDNEGPADDESRRSDRSGAEIRDDDVVNRPANSKARRNRAEGVDRSTAHGNSKGLGLISDQYFEQRRRLFQSRRHC